MVKPRIVSFLYSESSVNLCISTPECKFYISKIKNILHTLKTLFKFYDYKIFIIQSTQTNKKMKIYYVDCKALRNGHKKHQFKTNSAKKNTKFHNTHPMYQLWELLNGGFIWNVFPKPQLYIKLFFKLKIKPIQLSFAYLAVHKWYLRIQINRDKILLK